MKLGKDLIFSILMIVVGILLVTMRSGAISLAVTILGVALVVLGILDILVNKKDLVVGCIEILIGILLIVFAWVLTGIVLFIVAAVLVLYGVYGIYLAIKGGITPLGKFILALIVPVIYLVAGIFLFMNGFSWAFVVSGIILIIYGIMQAVQALTQNKSK